MILTIRSCKNFELIKLSLKFKLAKFRILLRTFGNLSTEMNT